MKQVATAVILAAVSCVAMAQEQITSNVIVARGVFSRGAKEGNSWTLKVDGALRYRDETILEVTLVTRAGDASNAFAPYDGQRVEISGDVKSVEHSTAALSNIRTIGILESPFSPTAFRSDASTRAPYKQAYYLFLVSPAHGHKLYDVPLLITQETLEEIASSKRPVLGVLILTYEREPIWEVKRVMPIDPAEIEVQPRIMHAGSTFYRYQEIARDDVLKLLENPLGTIPISRPFIRHKLVPRASVSELIADFRELASGGRPTRRSCDFGNRQPERDRKREHVEGPLSYRDGAESVAPSPAADRTKESAAHRRQSLRVYRVALVD
jgi:hypothetical protein